MDPLTWIMLSLMAAGTGASAVAQNKVNKARSGVMTEERTRRQKQQTESEAAAQNTATTYAKTKEQEAARAAEVAQMGAKLEAPTVGPQGTQFLGIEAPQNSTFMVEGLKDANARAQAQANQRFGAQAKMSAFGDVMLKNNLAASRNAQDIGQQAGFTRGWQQNVLPALLQKANMAGKSWATAGDIMKLAATIMTPFALAKSAAAKAAEQAGEAAGKASLAGAHDAFDPFAWQSWLKPAGARPPLL